MALGQIEADISYNPSSLLNIFSSTLNNETTRKIFKVKGIYTTGNGINYNGLYFDTLKDETSQACMTLLVPALIRSQLIPSDIIECSAYLTKKVQLNSGRIDLQLNVVDVLSKSASSYSEAQLKGFEILQRKAETGYKDVDGFIKSKIINAEPIAITILIGKAGIIDSDIKHQLKEAIAFYNINFIRINLTSERQIIEALQHFQNHCDILGISRGGGENLEIFESPRIAETALALSAFFITAIGHKDNVPLLQKVADKAFISPTALGQYFNQIYNDTVSELQNSKAKLVDDITKQLEANYKKQIENLNVNAEREIHFITQQLQVAKEEQIASNNQIQELQKRIEKPGKISVYTILLIIAALIIGWLIGKL